MSRKRRCSRGRMYGRVLVFGRECFKLRLEADRNDQDCGHRKEMPVPYYCTDRSICGSEA